MYYGIITGMINLKAYNLDTKQPMALHWKVKDISIDKVIWQGKTSNQIIEAEDKHRYRVVAISSTNKWAQVEPKEFTLSGIQLVNAYGKNGYDTPPTPTGDCYIEVVANQPLGICYRDSRNIKECVKNRTYWKPIVNCGSVTVAAVDEYGNFAHIKPNKTQITTPQAMARYTAIAPERSWDICPPVRGQVDDPTLGHISICGIGDINGDVYSYADSRFHRVVNGDTIIPDVKPGWYFMMVRSPSDAIVRPNPFMVVSGKTTSVRFTIRQTDYPQIPQTPPSPPPSYPMSYPQPSYPMSYPQAPYPIPTEAPSQTYTETITDKIKQMWYRYKLIIIAGGAVSGYYVYKHYKKRRR